MAETTYDPVVIWKPRSFPQQEFINCPVFEIFFGGARGSLKTDSTLGDWIRHSALYGENAVGLMVRRTREELSETEERFRFILTKLGFKFTGHVCRGPNGSRLTFAYLDNDRDADRYQGWSLTRVYVEEVGNFPSEAPIKKLMATLRSANGVPVGFRATGNPGGPGHQWVRARYIDPAPKGWEVQEYSYENPFTFQSVTRDRVFIPGKITDHDLLGPEYIAQLQMSGSEQLVRAWLMGDWNVVEGAFFDCWTDDMVIEPFPIPDHWYKFLSGDWGYAAPFCFHWFAVASEDTGDIPRGGLVCYREWYGCTSPNVGIRMDAEEVAEGLLNMTKEKLGTGVIDPATFATQSGPSIAERLMSVKQGKERLIFRPADNRRVGIRGALGGWDQMRSRMKHKGLFYFNTCKHAIRTIPMLQHDPDRPEDLDTESEDHAADTDRYACMSRPFTRKAPDEPKPVWHYEAETPNQIFGNVPIRELIDRESRRRMQE